MKNGKIRAIAEGAIMVALSVALSFAELDFWPDGGSIGVTMIPLIVYAVRRGAPWGVCAGLVFGTLKFFLGGHSFTWESILLDYSIAYALVGLAGLAKGRKNAMLWGALIGCGARFVAHYLSGVIIWGEWMPEEFLNMTMTTPYIYSALYNGGYMVANAIIAAVICYFLQKPLARFPAGGKQA